MNGASIPPARTLDDNRRVLPRFHAPDLDPAREVVLPADEARHLTRVLRLGRGAHVAVFDGRGREYRAEVVDAARDRAILRTIEPLAVPAGPAVAVTLVQAVLKGSSMDAAVRDATMMGVAAIQPLLTAHMDVKPSVATRDAAVERWRRIALASAKQSRRATLPAIAAPRALDACLAEPLEGRRLLFVEPSARCVPRAVKSLASEPAPQHAAVLIGPEGGWAAEEIEAALAAGCTAVSLGSLTIRAEAMPVAALAALCAVWP